MTVKAIDPKRPITNLESYSGAEVFQMMLGRIDEASAGKSITDNLVTSAKALTDLLQQVEVNHGGLIGTDVLTAANTLRLELSKWK